MSWRVMLFTALSIALPQAGSAQNADVEPKHIHGICAAANALLTTRMEPGMLADLIKSEAKRHSETARKLGASQQDLEQVLRAVAIAYNQGHMTWDEIADLGHDCANL